MGSDVSSVVAFGGNRIGVFWGNQVTGAFYFAVHDDGRSASAWHRSEVITGLSGVDDHLSVKAGPSGRIYAVVKTRATAPSDALISLLVRTPSGAWSAHVVGAAFDAFTRPICVVDHQHGVVFAYLSAPLGEIHEGAIQVKVAPAGAPVFEPGAGLPAIRDSRAPGVSDVTSTKQSVSGATGIVVLASNNVTERYWHAYTSLETSPLVREARQAAPSAGASVGVAEGSSASGTREILARAAPALLVAFGVPLWLLALASMRASRGLALAGTYGITLVAVAAGISLTLAALLP